MQIILEHTTPYLLIIVRVFPESKTSWSFTKAADSQGFTLTGTVQGQEPVYQPEESERLLTDAGTFNELLNFLLANSVITGSIVRLSKCFPTCRVNLKGCIFLKKINHWLIALHLTIFVFWENILRRDIFKILEIKLFRCCLNMLGWLTETFLKDLSVEFTNKRWHLCKFLENYKI